MRNIIIVSLLFLFPFTLFSQEWLTSFEDAKKEALSQNKKIVLVFQGSDWCAPCIKLDKEIWSTEEFQKLSKEHFVMLLADFPRKKANQPSEKLRQQNNALAEKYNSQGFFPLAVVLDYKGKVLGKMGYEKISPNDYFEKLTALEN